MKIDNFALTMHQACPRKFWYRMERALTKRTRTGALSFGAAAHAGLAEWYRQGHIDAGIEAIRKAWNKEPSPPEDWRTLDKCLAMMKSYAGVYGFAGKPGESWSIIGATDGLPLIERSFTLHTGMYLPCSKHLQHIPQDLTDPICAVCKEEREPIEYGGIIDGGIEYNDAYYILEHKTASRKDGSFWRQFKPNNQITGYIWAAQGLTDKPIGGALVNAIFVYKASATAFDRNFVTRTPEEIQEWLLNVYDVCVEIKSHQYQERWPMRTQSCTQYGLCEFHDVCSMEPDVREQVLEMDYEKRPWDYAGRDEVSGGSE